MTRPDPARIGGESPPAQPVPRVRGLTGLVINGVVHLIIAVNTTGWHSYCGINTGIRPNRTSGSLWPVPSSPRCRVCYPITQGQTVPADHPAS